MTALAIDHARMVSWAEFSGDWNPIHFDRAVAARLGAAERVVHGMIALVLAQEHVWRAATRDEDTNGWWAFHARLKRPIEESSVVRVVSRAAGADVRFGIEGTAGQTHVTGNLVPVDGAERFLREAPRGPVIALPSYRVDPQDACDRVARFAAVFPEVTAPWIGLSALFFSEFLVRNLATLRERTRTSARFAHVAKDDLVAVQTTHAVRFDAARSEAATLSWPGPLACDFAPLEFFAAGDGVAAECRWRVSCGGEPLMDMGVGLLIKNVGNPTQERT
ncbi:MAG TPA: MaoC family dehydratase [Labilithrix sp.]